MFIIKPENTEDWPEALLMLSYYHVIATMFSNGENTDGMHMLVDIDEEHEDGNNQVHLAEMCFQMNWHQVGKICDVCSTANEMFDNPETTCGHLQFNKPINAAF